MPENGHRRTLSSRLKSAGEEDTAVVSVEKENGVKASSATEDEFESARIRLRKRWELASVLNFLAVFEPVIECDLKLTAEEIEMALIKPDASLANLHVALLKGIPPVNKSLAKSDVWVTVLCKKLAEWWSWVAEGEIPLIVDKGEEISRYKELDPIDRLLMLKALCEVRNEQSDVISYINDMLKQGSQPSSFRKCKVGEDGNNTSYWYDGNNVIGHRLYREINKFDLKSKHKRRAFTDPPPNNLEWDTLATNLDEFRKVLDELSSSKVDAEVAVCKVIETNVIPELEKLQKKRERALKRQQRQDTLLNNNHAYISAMPRSCRLRKPVNYTFDDYDQAIDEAIKVTKTRNASEKQKRGVVSDTESDDHDDQRDGSEDSMDTDHETGEIEGGKENLSRKEENKSDHDPENNKIGHTNSTDPEPQEQIQNNANGSIGFFTRRLNSIRNNSKRKNSAMNHENEGSPSASDSDGGSSSKDPSQEEESPVASDSEDTALTKSF